MAELDEFSISLPVSLEMATQVVANTMGQRIGCDHVLTFCRGSNKCFAPYDREGCDSCHLVMANDRRPYDVIAREIIQNLEN